MGYEHHGSLRSHARRALVSNGDKYASLKLNAQLNEAPYSNSVKISKQIQFQEDDDYDNSKTMPSYKSRRQMDIENQLAVKEQELKKRRDEMDR